MSNPGAQRERIFMTGASGYIGSRIATFAIAEGYDVYGLSRSESSDAKMRALGVVPVRGDLHSLDVLRRESAQAQAVIHLADSFTGDAGDAYQEVVRTDNAAVDAMGEPLQGTGKPLIVTSGTLVVAADPHGAETTEASPLWENPLNDRIRSEQYALQLGEKGVKVCVVRLAPFVYGRGGSGVRLFMQLAVNHGEVIRIGDGTNRTSVVHVDDAARLYLLLLKKGHAGDIFNATSSTDVTSGQLAEAMSSCLGPPLHSVTEEAAESKYGSFLTRFITAENRASSAKAVKELGWQPTELGILEDIRTGSYLAVLQN